MIQYINQMMEDNGLKAISAGNVTFEYQEDYYKMSASVRLANADAVCVSPLVKKYVQDWGLSNVGICYTERDDNCWIEILAVIDTLPEIVAKFESTNPKRQRIDGQLSLENGMLSLEKLFMYGEGMITADAHAMTIYVNGVHTTICEYDGWEEFLTMGNGNVAEERINKEKEKYYKQERGRMKMTASYRFLIEGANGCSYAFCTCAESYQSNLGYRDKYGHCGYPRKHIDDAESFYDMCDRVRFSDRTPKGWVGFATKILERFLETAEKSGYAEELKGITSTNAYKKLTITKMERIHCPKYEGFAQITKL